MANRMNAGSKYNYAAHVERPGMRTLPQAAVNTENGVVVGLDDERAAQLGALAELPSLAEVLAAWNQRLLEDACEDYAADFRDVLMAATGELSPFPARVDANRGLVAWPGVVDGTARSLPMTYRTFGNILRHYCSPRRNVAANLVMLPMCATGPGHTGPTGREEKFTSKNQWDSPRSSAFNAMLDRKKATDARVTALTGEPVTTMIVRSRLLPSGPRVEGQPAPAMRRTGIGVVSPTHCLQDGDDDKLIGAISLAFAGNMETACASAFRGVEESELRAFFPGLQVEVPDTGSEKWTGYVTARNSESGAKSWSISAGLYRTTDGASVACEAIVRTGRHVGSHVAERMVEVADGAARLLKTLTEKAAELSSKTWDGSTDEFLRKLRAALAGTVLHDPDTCCGIAWAIGERIAQLNDPITVGLLMDVLGRAAGACVRRVDARPIEIMLGRTLVEGWKELKAVAVDVDDDGREEE